MFNNSYLLEENNKVWGVISPAEMDNMMEDIMTGFFENKIEVKIDKHGNITINWNNSEWCEGVSKYWKLA